MKFFLVFVAVLGLSYGCSENRDPEVDEALDQLREFVTAADIAEIIRRHYAISEEVQRAIAYLQEEDGEWAAIVAGVAGREEWQRAKERICEIGLDVDAIIATIRGFIDSVGTEEEVRGARTMRDLVDEIRASVDLDGLLVTLSELLETNASFQEFYALISSPEARELVQSVRATEEVQRLAQALRDLNIDVDALVQFVQELLGWD